LIAPFIRLFGDTLLAAQLPGLLCGAVLPVLTYVLGRRVWSGERGETLALYAALCVLSSATLLYQSASTDSAAPFALLAGLALWLAGDVALPGRDHKWAWRWPVAGALVGLAYLARADGILLLLVVPAAALWRRRASWAGWRDAALVVVGFLASVAPWWARNAAVFGRPTPVSIVTAIALQDYTQLFNFNAPPTLAGLLERGVGFILDLRLRALWHNLGVLVSTTFPYGVLGLPGFWLLRQRWPVAGGAGYGLLLYLVTALVFSVPTMAGTFYHSVGALTPWLAVGAVEVLCRAQALLSRVARQRLPLRPLALGLLVLVVAQAFLAWPAVAARSRDEQAQFARLARWLQTHAAPDEVVMTTQPHTLNYAVGHPAVMLPGGQPPGVVWAAAREFSVELVVVTNTFGLYPDALADAPGFEPLSGPEGVAIYRIVSRSAGCERVSRQWPAGR